MGMITKRSNTLENFMDYWQPEDATCDKLFNEKFQYKSYYKEQLKKIILLILFFFFQFGSSQTIIKKDDRYGVLLKNKQIIPTDYDSVRIANEFILLFKKNKINVYNLKGEKLRDNIKSYYYFSKRVMQIIESSSKMLFINPQNEVISPIIIKNINKKSIPFISNDEIGNNQIFKYIIINKKEVLKELIHYSKDSVRNSIKSIFAPSNLTYVNLINNKKRIELPPLKQKG